MKKRNRKYERTSKTNRSNHTEEQKFGKKKTSYQKGKKFSKDTPTYNFHKYNQLQKEEDTKKTTVRLNRFIANAGICSRREADTLIQKGLIQVNGQTVTEMGYQVNPSDTVTYNGEPIKKEKLVYVLLNKPKNYITTMDDPKDRKTVMSLVQRACEERIYPVGRLDRNTVGLLLFTNDGLLAEKLTHPSHQVRKVYEVTLDKSLTEEAFDQIQRGVTLEDGKATVDRIVLLEDKKVGLELHIGRNRIVRRIFESLGYEVLKLDRTVYAGLTKKDLPRGKWRFLTEKEIVRLKYIL
ncbi:MAG: pseudouridine synthase [Thermonemataceae bacterium]